MRLRRMRLQPAVRRAADCRLQRLSDRVLNRSSLTGSREAALAGARPPPGAKAGLLGHPPAGGRSSGSAANALSGTAGTSGPGVPPVALPGGARLLLLHVQPDVSSELDGLKEQRERQNQNFRFWTQPD